MSTTNLPVFTGSLTDIRAVLEYITDPTNAAILSIDAQVAILEASIAAATVNTISDAPPTSAERGHLWTVESTGQLKYCHTTYASGDPDPDSKWTATSDTTAQGTVQALAQLNSPTPQVSLLTATMTGFGADSSIAPAEKTTIKSVYDEIVARKAEIDVNSVRYSLTGETTYTDYTASYTSWKAYIDGLLLFNDMNAATAVVPATWNAEWSSVLPDEAGILTDIRGAAQDLVDTIQGDTTTVQAQVDEMTADGTISPTEKVRFRQEWTRIQDEYSTLYAQATEYSLTGDADVVQMKASYDALSTYLGTTLDLFSDMSTGTILTDQGSNATEFELKFQTYYIDTEVADDHIDAYFKGLIDTNAAEITTINNELDAISDDGIVSGGTEKETVLARWKDIQRLHGEISYYAGKYTVSIPAAYSTAYTDLSTYLVTTITLFDDMSVDTAVTRAVFNAKFDDFFFQYDVLSQLVADAQRIQVDNEPVDYDDYKALIDSAVDDGIVSAGTEKNRLNNWWLDVQATHSIIKVSATNAGVNTTAYQAAYDDISTYLGTLTAPGGGSANFTIENEDTAIGVSTFFGKIRTYESAKAQLSTDVIGQIINLQGDAAKSILDMNDDGIISVAEKANLFQEYQRLTADKAQLDAQADLLSITTEKTDMDAAYTTLVAFLDSLESGAGLFTDMTTATTLLLAEKNAWDGHWNLLFTTMATLETTIVATIVGNTSAVGTASFLKDGTVAATGDFDLGGNAIGNVLAKTLASGNLYVATNGQLYTEQQARVNHEGLSAAVHGVTGSVVGTTDSQTLTSKTINADNNTLSEIEVDNLKTGVVEADVLGSVTADDSTVPSTKATKAAVTATTGVHGISGNVVGTSDSQTLTNKIIGGSQITDATLPTAKISDIATSLTPADHNTIVSALGIKNYGDANWGGGGGGGGASVEGTSELYTVKKETASASLNGELLGTRIDTSDGGYATSSFSFVMEATAEDSQSTMYTLKAHITKESGGDPYVIFRVERDHHDAIPPLGYWVEGTMSTTPSELEALLGGDSTASGYKIKREDAGNELAFRFILNISSDSYSVLSGIRTYSGTDITSSIGTVVSQSPLTVSANATSEDYGVYVDDSEGAAGTGHTTPVMGTRIDVSDPQWSASTFSFIATAIFHTTSGYWYRLEAIIKKQSGSDPYAILDLVAINQGNDSLGGVNRVKGSISTTGSISKDPVSGMSLSSFGLVSSIPGNELCYALTIDSDSSVAFSTIEGSMIGPKKYEGTPIGSAGTAF